MWTSSGWGLRGRCDSPPAPAALPDRKLRGCARLRAVRVWCRGDRHRGLRLGLRHSHPGRRRRHRGSRRELPAAQPAARVLDPGLPRGANLRRALLRHRGLDARAVRRRLAAGQLRDPAGGDHELRPEDAAQLLLEPVDQPRDPLSGGRLRVGLRLRAVRGRLALVPRRLLDGVAPASDRGSHQGPCEAGRDHARGRAGGRAGGIHRHPAALRHTHLAARDLAAELRRVQGRHGERGAAPRPDRRRLDGSHDERRPPLPREAWRCACDVRAHGCAGVLAWARFRHVPRRRLDRIRPHVSPDRALRAAAPFASASRSQPRDLRADISNPSTDARSDQCGLSDPEPVRARRGPPRGRVRYLPHAAGADSRPDILGRFLHP